MTNPFPSLSKPAVRWQRFLFLPLLLAAGLLVFSAGCGGASHPSVEREKPHEHPTVPQNSPKELRAIQEARAADVDKASGHGAKAAALDAQTREIDAEIAALQAERKLVVAADGAEHIAERAEIMYWIAGALGLAAAALFLVSLEVPTASPWTVRAGVAVSALALLVAFVAPYNGYWRYAAGAVVVMVGAWLWIEMRRGGSLLTTLHATVRRVEAHAEPAVALATAEAKAATGLDDPRLVDVVQRLEKRALDAEARLAKEAQALKA